MKLSMVKRDPDALAGGVWITPSKEHDIAFLVRAQDGAFYNALSLAQREAVRKARQEGRISGREGLEALPVTETLALEHRLVLDRHVLGVRNLFDDAGEPVTVETLRELALAEEYRPLLSLALDAVQQATERRASDRKAAEGNSARSSATTDSGAAPPS